MDNEPYTDLTHAEAVLFVAAEARRAGNQAWPEFVLPSGKRADVLVITSQGNIEIVEVKVQYFASLAEDAFDKYWSWCHRLYLGLPNLRTGQPETGLWPLRWSGKAERVGLIGIDREGLTWLRIPDTHTMTHDAQQQMLGLIPR